MWDATSLGQEAWFGLLRCLLAQVLLILGLAGLQLESSPS